MVISWPIRSFVMDLTGRVIVDCGLLDSPSGSHSIEKPEGSPTGVYFLVLQSAVDITARKLLCYNIQHYFD